MFEISGVRVRDELFGMVPPIAVIVFPASLGGVKKNALWWIDRTTSKCAARESI